MATTVLVLSACWDVEIQTPDWDWGDFDDTRNTAQAEFRYAAGVRSMVSLTGIAGSVDIVGRADAAEIVVKGLRRVHSQSQTDAREHLADVAVDVWQAGDTVFIQTVQPAFGRGRSYGVEYTVEVPTATDLRVRQTTGPVDIRSVSGHVDTRVTAGSVTLRDLTGNVGATVITGDLEAAVALSPNGIVDLRASTGNIELSIPKETSAALRAVVTASGHVRLVDLVLVDTDPRDSVLQASMADADGTIRLETVVGDITVKGR